MFPVLLLAARACGTADPAPASLLRMDDEPAGAHCAAGGLAVSNGRDTDGDDTLDDAEVTDTRYVCNGSAGAAGADGADGEDGEDGLDGVDGADGEDGAEGSSLAFGDLERIEDGTQSELVEGVADTDGFLLVDQGSNENVSAKVYVGPTPDTVERVGFFRLTVPVPAGWAWRVEVTNAAWADLNVIWTPLVPAGG
jgi:hypothetical protein